MNDLQQIIVFAVVLPAVLTCVLMLTAWRPWQRTRAEDNRLAFLAPLALMLSLLSAYAVIVRGLPQNAWERIGWLILAIGLLAVALDVVARVKRINWVNAWAHPIVVLAGVVCTWLAMQPMIQPRDPAWMWLLLLGGPVLVISAIERPIARWRGVVPPVALAACAGALAAVANFSGSSKLAMILAALMTSCGVMIIFTVWNRSVSINRGVTLLAGFIIPVGALIGWLYDTAFGPWPFALPIAALLLMPALDLPCFRRLPGWLTVVIRLTALLTPMAIAIWLATGQSDTSMYY